MVLANALENAIHACEKLPQGAPRRLKLSLALADQRRLTIRVENSCPEDVELDSRGFPTTPPREGHGLGLKNIALPAGYIPLGTFTISLLEQGCKGGHVVAHIMAVAAAQLQFFLYDLVALAQSLHLLPGLSGKALGVKRGDEPGQKCLLFWRRSPFWF